MMSSSSDGEKLAAVAAVGRILDKHGMRFRDLAPEPAADSSPWSGAPVNPWKPRPRHNEINLGWQHQLLARALLQTGHRWTEWESRFLTNMTTRTKPSPKEVTKLAELKASFWGDGQ
jgi:hypothetical protein